MPFSPADADIDPPTNYYFHGTRASLTRGDVVLPRKEHGGPPTSGPLIPGGQRLLASDDYVYITRRHKLAWAYAHASGGRGKPIVLIVEPQGTVEPDPEHSTHMHAYRCKSAQVLLVDDTPAISAEVAENNWKREPTESQPTYVVKNVKPQGAPD